MSTLSPENRGGVLRIPLIDNKLQSTNYNN